MKGIVLCFKVLTYRPSAFISWIFSYMAVKLCLQSVHDLSSPPLSSDGDNIDGGLRIC
jgi:hypothetical protein